MLPRTSIHPAQLATLVVWMFTVALLSANEARPLDLPGLHNFFDLGGGLYSGSSPGGDAGFAALARLGVKTIISVDGAKPDVEGARRHGMRCIHLPVGYDGISPARVLALAKAAQVLRGPIFVHCHHGKHRGPAAAAVICRVRNRWSVETAAAWLRQAGTSEEYAGLHRSVREFRVPGAATLAEVRADFPEVAPTPVLVDAMVAVDDCFDALKAARKNGWREPAEKSAFTPAQTAALLREHFREIARAPAARAMPADFRNSLGRAEQAGEDLRTALAKREGRDEIERAFKRASASCAECHRAHRDAGSSPASSRAAR